MNMAGVDALETAYLRAKESEGGALGDVAALGEIADRIIGMVDKGAAIDARNRAERAQAFGRTVTVKIKFCDFRLITRIRSQPGVVADHASLRPSRSTQYIPG